MRASKQQGFTLIEILLALSITTVLIISAFSALRLGFSSWERGEALLGKSALKRNIISRFEREASSIYPFTLKQESKIAFLGKKDSVGFATVATMPSTIHGARWAFYTVGEKGLAVHEKFLTDEDLISFEGGELVESETSVKGMSLEYLGKEGWSSEWEPRKDELPNALRAKVLMADGDSVLITVPVGVGLIRTDKHL